ncbi:ATPase [Paenibacillus pectinilyticus]|uniref:ATPase n=1 Tax=Paenibacillus pectinilyticus TaxID=512399 RepID=A0A1C1A219_9BACL|nr:BadF/BadG/BcrA/BcrD ATPase family protein [Paenibacillus pectinilyticus]OCT14580.1 ATPase [Paenibacillus pectinilyticus]
MSTETYILGVDGGGSKTYAVIVDRDGHKISSGISGSSNHQVVGIDQAYAAIKESIEQALHAASLSYSDMAFAQYALAGLDRPHDHEIVRKALSQLPFARWDMAPDTMAGLRTGSLRNVGIVLICGSGTNAAGRNEAGATVQVGGVGYLYGDSLGANYMATTMFRTAVRSWEGREIASSLPDKLLAYFGYSTMEALVDHFLERNIQQIREGALTISLHAAADAGDELAIRLLKEAGKELGVTGNAVIRKLGGFKGDTVPVVLIGSVLQKGRNPHLLEELRNTLETENPNVELMIPEMAPVYGAILLAFDHLQIPTSEGTHRRFSEYGGYEQQ